ncbi:MAG: SDR family oxidoreductase [Ignavibacteria bacterium]|nr:SDR family oxidoreductase [Ignavibacteria bacterium]
MKLQGSNILITGGSLGIGKETAKCLVDAGAKVGITGRDASRLNVAAEYSGAFPIVADVTKPEDIERTYQEFLAHAGGLDVLINNAGLGAFPNLLDATLDQYEHVFRTNVFGPALMAQKAAGIFISQQSGTIINIGSTASLRGFERGGIYAASKFALRAMTESWQHELRKHSIRVMQVNPSEVATAFNSEERIERIAADNKLRSQEIAYMIKSILELDDRAMIPEFSVWASNPWKQ